MTLTEQQYKNLNRRYFHGSQNGRLNPKEGRQDFLYLSNSFVYSSMYACQIDPLRGKVFEFRLKEGLNIFNAKCKSDLLRLKLYARKNNIDWEKLEKEDWSLLKSKSSIIELIRKLGFDGFFDWEWTDNLRNYRKEAERELKGQFLDNSPAVGIFDVEKLKQVQTYQYSDYFEFDDFVKIYNVEKQTLKNYAGTLYVNKKDLYPAILYYAQDHFLFLTEKDLEEVLNSMSGYVKSTEFEIMDILDECLKFGISKNGKHELTEELQVRPVNNKLKEQFGKNYEKFYREYRKLNRELHIKN